MKQILASYGPKQRFIYFVNQCLISLITGLNHTHTHLQIKQLINNLIMGQLSIAGQALRVCVALCRCVALSINITQWSFSNVSLTTQNPYDTFTVGGGVKRKCIAAHMILKRLTNPSQSVSNLLKSYQRTVSNFLKSYQIFRLNFSIFFLIFFF